MTGSLAPPRRIDVCNGDADGLCAVVQWRLHAPAPADLVTGLKREIALLDRVCAGAGDEILVCDLSMRRNAAGLSRLLAAGARVRYFDHHAVEDVPRHPGLEAHIDPSSDVCTSLLVDRHLGGAYAAWALVGAYGDNLSAVADARAAAIGFDDAQRDTLRRLGEAINHNAYGESEADVRITPARLFEILLRHPDPLHLARQEPIVRALQDGQAADLRQALTVAPLSEDAHTSVRLLPDVPWGRRASGCLANDLAIRSPARAHAVLLQRADGYRVSVRAPLVAPGGADVLVRRFGGAGRAGAAGIDRLPLDARDAFIEAFVAMDWAVHRQSTRR